MTAGWLLLVVSLIRERDDGFCGSSLDMKAVRRESGRGSMCPCERNRMRRVGVVLYFGVDQEGSRPKLRV